MIVLVRVTPNDLQVVLAKECNFNSSQPGIVSSTFNYEGDLVLTSQDQINAVFAGCTSLVDGVVIHPNFTGSTIDFRNLTKMGGLFIETNTLTTILLDNLEETDAIVYIVDNATITTLSAPKLRRAQWLGFSATMSNLNFPALERIEWRRFGILTDLRLPEGLKEYLNPIKSRLWLKTANTTAVRFSAPQLRFVGGISVHGAAPGLNFTLPELDFADELRLSGVFTEYACWSLRSALSQY